MTKSGNEANGNTPTGVIGCVLHGDDWICSTSLRYIRLIRYRWSKICCGMTGQERNRVISALLRRKGLPHYMNGISGGSTCPNGSGCWEAVKGSTVRHHGSVGCVAASPSLVRSRASQHHVEGA